MRDRIRKPVDCFPTGPGERKSGGFSLPELLITVLLVSILFGLAVLFSTGTRQTRKMRDYEIAIALAQQAMEVLRAAPFGMLDDADAGKASVEADLNTSNGKNDILEPVFVTNKIKYERTVEVLDVPPREKDGIPLGLKGVRVSVKWFPPTGEDIPPFEVFSTIADCN